MRRLERQRKRPHVSRQTSRKGFHLDVKKRKNEGGVAVGGEFKVEGGPRPKVGELY
jgi:hypothetical protein